MSPFVLILAFILFYFLIAVALVAHIIFSFSFRCIIPGIIIIASANTVDKLFFDFLLPFSLFIYY